MGALDGLKIADFSWVGAGPRATKDLADNGATVIKIESARRLDLGRRSPPFAGDPRDYDGSAFFAQTNTSKQSVTINLGDPRGVDIARRLIAWADVVVENFGPGYMERIGLDYATLREIRPDVILASVSVAGRQGPMAGFRGYGNSAAAHSGHAALTGWPGRDPHMPPLAYGDVVAPMFATVAILAALEYRARTGEGQHLDVSQVEPMVHVIADLYADPPASKPANSDPLMAPHDVFPCQGTDAWVAIAVAEEAQWQALCTILGAPDLITDPRFATRGARQTNGAALYQELCALTVTWDKQALDKALCDAGVPAGACANGKDVLTSDELLAAGHFIASDHPVLGRSMMPAPPMQFSDTEWRMRPAPCLGADNHAVFVEMLGMNAQEVELLAKTGVLA